MKKIIIILLALIWVSSLIILIIALIGSNPNNPLIEYRFIVGIGFIVLSSFIGTAYQQLFKRKT